MLYTAGIPEERAISHSQDRMSFFQKREETGGFDSNKNIADLTYTICHAGSLNLSRKMIRYRAAISKCLTTR
jgi:hypothetical protein